MISPQWLQEIAMDLRVPFAQYTLATVVALGALLAPRPAAAISLSHGLQHLPISQEECGRRGASALQNEGYGAPAPAVLMSGFKGPHGVYIVCTARPDGTAVTIFVASEGVTDGNIPGAERVRLQERMGAATTITPGPVFGGGAAGGGATCRGFGGVWAMADFGEATLGVDANGRVGGTYTNGAGRIDGSVIGDQLSATWTQPGRTGGVQARLASDGRSFSCQWSEGGRVAGGCNATCKGAVSGPIAPPPGASFDGQWDTSYGLVVLNVQGNQVSGTYTQPPGRIHGTLNGTVLDATWSQADRSGRMRLQMAPDGRSFTGTWTEADGRGGGAWNGTRR